MTPTRPTQRCLVESLTSGWDDVSDARAVKRGAACHTKAVHLLGHPIIRKAAEDFAAGDGSEQKHESISGLPNPVFWKVKTERWRGAVYVDTHGQAWLVAAGMRYANERSKDFYKNFMSDVLSYGAEPFLPTAEDLEILSLELNEHRVKEFEADVSKLARSLITAARRSDDQLASGDLTLAHEDPQAARRTQVLARITVLIDTPDRNTSDPYAILVEVNVKDWSHRDLLAWEERVFLGALCGCEGRWGSTESSGARLHSMDVMDSDELDAICRGDLASKSPGHLAPGTTTHTVHRKRLTESTVKGEPVQALCGQWFVPRQDYEALPMCPTCQTLDDFLGIDPSSLRDRDPSGKG